MRSAQLSTPPSLFLPVLRSSSSSVSPLSANRDLSFRARFFFLFVLEPFPLLFAEPPEVSAGFESLGSDPASASAPSASSLLFVSFSDDSLLLALAACASLCLLNLAPGCLASARTL